MELSDKIAIPATKHIVYTALNNPEILKHSIPGCEEFIQSGPAEYEAKVALRLGPIRARFKGKVTLKATDPPNAFTLVGEGSGGATGFAQGSANVSLEENVDETILRYEAHASIGGKIAQLGNRLIHGAVQKLSAEFFSNFASILSEKETMT